MSSSTRKAENVETDIRIFTNFNSVGGSSQ